MDIRRTSCTFDGCKDPVWYRRLCKVHHKVKHPDEKIREFCFRWQLVDEYSATVRAETREKARELVKNGVVRGNKDVTAEKYAVPIGVECVKEVIYD
jgi:hypothetical protein